MADEILFVSVAGDLVALGLRIYSIFFKIVVEGQAISTAFSYGQC